MFSATCNYSRSQQNRQNNRGISFILFISSKSLFQNHTVNAGIAQFYHLNELLLNNNDMWILVLALNETLERETITSRINKLLTAHFLHYCELDY